MLEIVTIEELLFEEMTRTRKYGNEISVTVIK